MHLRTRTFAAAALAVLLAACGDTAPTAPAPTAGALYSVASTLPAVRFSEIHYDNASTDVGEAIEISGPAGTDVTGWSVVLYNGASTSLKVYGTRTLSGTIPAVCGDRGVVVLEYPSNGIQNGDPDGFALVNAAGEVVEFLSYGGTFTAADGPALNMTSADIGAKQSGTTSIGSSLQRDAGGAWTATTQHSFGACNDNGDPPPPATVASIVVSPATATIAAGATQVFTATAYSAAGAPLTGVPFTWSSSSTSVATVSETGVVVGAGTGEATITAAHAEIEGQATVTVTAVSAPPGNPELWISEIHYDNAGVDSGEAIEVEGKAGANLAGWSLVLYNGGNGATYGTVRQLSGIIPDQCDGRGVAVEQISGIQNGDPDGVALIDPAGAVVEFISYGGVFTATNGPANGRTSVDIGVKQSSSTPIGQSLQRYDGVWDGPKGSTFGACNPPPPPPSPIVISELLGDPVNADGASWGEWFEVHNRSGAAIDLQGWTIASGGSSQPPHVIQSSVVVPAGGYVVLGRGGDSGRNGGIELAYNYFTGSSSTIWLDNSDWLALRDGSGVTADSVAWTSLARGVSSGVRDLDADNTSVNGPNWGYSTTTFGAGDYGTPGAPNGTLASAAPAVKSVTLSGRSSGDTPLPVGFETQLFATYRDEAGAVVQTTFNWTSETPAIISVDSRGVIRSLAAGTGVIRATAADGTWGRISVATTVATASVSASYVGNTEFGVPRDADPSDDIIITYDQFTSSFNPARGIPNWVSYNLEASHFGGEDRCNCFTFDPQIPATVQRYTTADYTGAGAHHGYGIDRGHLARSFDRTSGTLDNARTFYFTNIFPQAADMNQGPWAVMENDLGNLARNQNREVYIVTGVSGSKGTVKDEGIITIPEYAWKVAIVMPRDGRLGDVTSPADVEVIAVIMPNVPGIRNDDWRQYTTTVDAVEALSGYDLLALLPDEIEEALESGLAQAVAHVAMLVADGKLSQGNGTALQAKLDAAVQQLARGNRTAAANQLRALLNQLAEFESTGKLTAADAAPLRAIVQKALSVIAG